MKISGFSYIRNGFTYGYPFLESIQSILPICDEFIMVVGESTDGTREAIENLNSPKIKIIDSVWDESLREGGKVFAQQANLGLDAVTGDWAFHIQADEVVHEKDLPLIKESLLKYLYDIKVEGFLFNFLNFYGGYSYIGSTRRWHRREVRIVRNWPNIRSFRDSQGFRIYPSVESYKNGDNGRPLNVAKLDVNYYHYSYARNPKLMQKKANYFNSFWHDDEWLAKNNKKVPDFNFSVIDDLTEFKGSHPAIMKPKVDAQDWEFTFDKSRRTFKSMKDRVLFYVEKLTGWRIGEYRNYRVIR